MARGGVRIPITSDASGVSAGVRDAERALDRLNKSGSRTFSALKFGAAGAAVALGGGFAAALRTGIGEMMEAEKVSAQTAATLKSTGNAAGVTQKQVEGLASRLQALTGVSDDQIQSAQNLLLTFTKISGDTFPRATRAALDLSVAFGKDMNASAVMLGKALQDPIKGVSALSRVGVSFTAQQKEQIKAMVEAGKTADAQRLILKELETQVGGSGKAFGETLPGKLQRLQRAWEDTSQAIAVAFLPILERIATAALKNRDKLEGVFKGIARAVNGLVTFVGAIIDGDWKKAWDTAADGAGKALRAIGVLAEKVLLPLAKKAGRAIVEGLAAGVDEALSNVPGGGALRRILGFESAQVSSTVRVQVIGGSGVAAITGQATPVSRGATGAPPTVRGPGQRRAMGGYIDGPSGAGDIVPAMLSPGEVVLNEGQQRILGVDRIREVLARTGGVLGGFRFASGGVAEDSFSGSGGVKSNVMNFYRQLVEAVPGGQYLMSGYRAGSRIAGSGRISLHASGMAVDIGSRSIRNAGSPSVIAPDLDRIAYMARKALGHPLQVGGTTSNGLGEVLWRTMQGGNHYDHVHIGLKTGGTPQVPGATGGHDDHDHPPARRVTTTGVVTSPMVGGSGPVFPGFGRRGAGYAETDPDALVEWRPGVSSTRNAVAQVGRTYTGADGRTYFTTTPIINAGAPGLVVDPSLGRDPADLVMAPDQADLIRARTNMLMTEWGLTSRGAGDIGTGGSTAMAAAFPGGRTVTLTVGASSLVSAVASAAGGQGYSTPAAVPAGV